METHPVPKTTDKLQEINYGNFFCCLQWPSKVLSPGIWRLVYVEAMYLPTFGRKLLSLKRLYTSTRLHQVTFEKCNAKLLVLMCKRWCNWGLTLWTHLLVIILIFVICCFELLQGTFTKDNRKTANGNSVFFTGLGKLQYMLHDSHSDVRTGLQMCRF